MKCPNCGAEIESGKFCEYCGAQLSSEQIREQELINKEGCPKCGSSNVSFSREKQGEFKGKNSSFVVRNTIGLCKDCGYTWTVTGKDSENPKRKTWLWVLGWIFVFPVPLMLILRKKEMNNALKWVIIVLAWLAYIGLVIAGGSSSKTQNSSKNSGSSVVVASSSSAAGLSSSSASASSSVAANEQHSIAESSTTANTESKSYSEVCKMIDALMASQYPGNYKLTSDDTGITINLWENGIIQLVTLAKQGDKASKTSWDNLVDSIKKMSAETKESALKKYGYSDKYIMVNVLNNLNKDNTLLVVTDGVVFYDEVNGINLLGV